MSEPETTIRRTAKQDYEFHAADAAERVRIQASLADRALQSAIIVNGGAVVALFSFVASAGGGTVDRGVAKLTFGCFAVGLALALLAHVFAFVSQDRFLHASVEEMWRAQRTLETNVSDADQSRTLRAMSQGNAYYVAGLATFVVSIAVFATGSYFALSAVLAR